MEGKAKLLGRPIHARLEFSPLGLLAAAALLAVLVSGAVAVRGAPAQAAPRPDACGAPATPTLPRRLSAGGIRLPPGHLLEPVVVKLSVPTTLVFDGAELVLAESGWAQTAEPRVLRLRPESPSRRACPVPTCATCRRGTG
jgi:hypothetical protein